jgi:N-acetyl-alpha-D-muramate 1-phosphate uridylyltransferase
VARAEGGFDVLTTPGDAPRHTYSGIGVYRPEFFEGSTDGRFPLLPLLRRAGAAGRLRGRLYQGLWCDVGTPERLRELDERLGGGAVG